MKPDREKRPSRLTRALFFLGTMAVFTVVDVLVYGTPASPKDLAVLAAILMVANSIWVGFALVWDRITRKRRSYLGG